MFWLAEYVADNRGSLRLVIKVRRTEVEKVKQHSDWELVMKVEKYLNTKNYRIAKEKYFEDDFSGEAFQEVNL